MIHLLNFYPFARPEEESQSQIVPFVIGFIASLVITATFILLIRMARQFIRPNISAVESLTTIHSKARDLFLKALELDEETGKGKTDEAKEVIIQMYSKGVVEMTRGLAIQLDPKSREYEKSVEIRETMKKNLAMVQGRIEDLRKSKMPVSKSDAKLQPQASNALRRGSTFNCGRPSSAVTAPRASKPVTSVPRTNLYTQNQPSKAIHKPPPTTPFHKRNNTSALPKSRSTPANLSGRKLTAESLKIPNVEPKLVNSILDEIIRPHENVFFKDIAGNEEAKRSLQENVIIPQKRPDIFSGLRSPVKACLMYGPPGNGKTFLVKALANEANFTFMNITPSSITSKWYGEGEKLVRALFAVARALQPTIIFIDEIDSILRSRSNNEHEASRKIKNTFFVEMDGIGTDPKEQVILVAATNLPNQLDSAILRRFPLKIYIRLPDFKTRIQLLEQLLAKANNPLSPNELKEIAQLTDGYSASDITSLTRDASLGPTRDFTLEQLVTIDKKAIRKIQVRDFLTSLKTVKPSVSRSSLEEFDSMARNYST